MTQKEMFPTVTSSPQDTPANPSPSRGGKKALKMTATSGRTSLELLHKKDRLGAFLLSRDGEGLTGVSRCEDIAVGNKSFWVIS